LAKHGTIASFCALYSRKSRQAVRAVTTRLNASTKTKQYQHNAPIASSNKTSAGR
jgi:hypothetical protein